MLLGAVVVVLLVQSPEQTKRRAACDEFLALRFNNPTVFSMWLTATSALATRRSERTDAARAHRPFPPETLEELWLESYFDTVSMVDRTSAEIGMLCELDLAIRDERSARQLFDQYFCAATDNAQQSLASLEQQYANVRRVSTLTPELVEGTIKKLRDEIRRWPPCERAKTRPTLRRTLK